MKLYCIVCLHTNNDVAQQAETISNGYAVCIDHLGYVDNQTDIDRWKVISNGN